METGGRGGRRPFQIRRRPTIQLRHGGRNVRLRRRQGGLRNPLVLFRSDKVWWGGLSMSIDAAH